jgi:hypothetical protein
MKRAFDIDQLTGAVETFHFDEMSGQSVIQTTEDVQPILDANQSMMNQGDSGYSKSRELKRIANIPMSVLMEWNQKLGIDLMKQSPFAILKDRKVLARFLNDPSYQKVRTAAGRF